MNDSGFSHIPALRKKRRREALLEFLSNMPLPFHARALCKQCGIALDPHFGHRQMLAGYSMSKHTHVMLIL